MKKILIVEINVSTYGAIEKTTVYGWENLFIFMMKW